MSIKLDRIFMHKVIVDKLHDVYERKNHDYGGSFTELFEKYGMVSPMIKITDKFKRLESLCNKEEDSKIKESINDTLIDLANYAIMTVIERSIKEMSDDSSKIKSCEFFKWFNEMNEIHNYEEVPEDQDQEDYKPESIHVSDFEFSKYNFDKLSYPYCGDFNSSDSSDVSKSFDYKSLPNIIAVDFDGTLVEDGFPDISNAIPNNKLFEKLLKAKSDGSKIILWTCRTGSALDDAVEYCNNKGLHFDAVNDNIDEVKFKLSGGPRKVYANLYIDDLSCDENANF